MSKEFATIPVEEVSGTMAPDPAWQRLTVAEARLQMQVQQLVTVQGSINNIEAMLGKLYEAQGLDKPANVSNGEGGTGRIRPAAPPDFDGTHEKGQAFLNGCLFYFDAVGHQFPDEQARRVATHANRIMQAQRKTGIPFFANWSAFETHFWTCYLP